MTLSYRIEGEGTPLLMVHGFGVTFSIWHNLAPLLSPYYKLIMIELPGNGHSPEPSTGFPSYYRASAEEIEGLRQELGIEHWSMLGYSIGAWVTQTYLSAYAEHVERIFFLCPALIKNYEVASLQMLKALDERHPAVGNWILSGWRLRELVILLGFNGERHPLSAEWEREILTQPVNILKKGLYDLPGAGRAPFDLPTKPARFIWAKDDFIVARPAVLRPVDRLVPGCHSSPLLYAPEIAACILQ